MPRFYWFFLKETLIFLIHTTIKTKELTQEQKDLISAIETLTPEDLGYEAEFNEWRKLNIIKDWKHYMKAMAEEKEHYIKRVKKGQLELPRLLVQNLVK